MVKLTFTTYDIPSHVMRATESFLLTVASGYLSSGASGTSDGAGNTSGLSPGYRGGGSAGTSLPAPLPAPEALAYDTVAARRNVRPDGAWYSSFSGRKVLTEIHIYM